MVFERIIKYYFDTFFRHGIILIIFNVKIRIVMIMEDSIPLSVITAQIKRKQNSEVGLIFEKNIKTLKNER